MYQTRLPRIDLQRKPSPTPYRRASPGGDDLCPTPCRLRPRPPQGSTDGHRLLGHTYRWQKNGTDLFDGPSDGGGTIGGAATSTLVITELASADQGVYTLAASNECGTSVSDPIDVSVVSPPDIHVAWTATALHPNGALTSRAYGVGDGQETGTATYPGPEGDEEHAMLWVGSAESAIDLHDPSTIKTGAVATANGVQAGNWWEPFEIFHNGQWYLVYFPEACLWSGTAGSFQNLRVSGWEYSGCYDTDGVRQIGAVSRDDEVGNVYTRAGMWAGTSGSWISLHPGEGVSNSSGAALDGDHQYGSILTPYPGPIRKAARWSGTAASYEDMHPTGASRSWVTGAGDGQQVGTAEFGGVLKPMIWSGHRLSAIDLSGSDGQSPSVEDAAGGLQVGVRMVGTSHAVVLATNGDDWVDLHETLGPEYTMSGAEAIDVEQDGRIRIVGWARNTTLSRNEAFLWTSGGVSDISLDDDADGEGLLGAALELRLGPNPVDANTVVQLRSPQAGSVDLTVFDIAGRKCGGFVWNMTSGGDQRIPLGPILADLPGGAYFVRASMEDGTSAVVSCRVVR